MFFFSIRQGHHQAGKHIVLQEFTPALLPIWRDNLAIKGSVPEVDLWMLAKVTTVSDAAHSTLYVFYGIFCNITMVDTKQAQHEAGKI